MTSVVVSVRPLAFVDYDLSNDIQIKTTTVQALFPNGFPGNFDVHHTLFLGTYYFSYPFGGSINLLPVYYCDSATTDITNLLFNPITAYVSRNTNTLTQKFVYLTQTPGQWYIWYCIDINNGYIIFIVDDAAPIL